MYTDFRLDNPVQITTNTKHEFNIKKAQALTSGSPQTIVHRSCEASKSAQLTLSHKVYVHGGCQTTAPLTRL